ncbi:uncharacterized protein LOC122425624 isoform X2 [Cervus canadensis]|uniref:uncharacterized protein LOC122425624 isoform X2 n=1 Tax=Cervus canadensis TaxID=1574408 RepID=UPI001C9E39E8|nr:uncharacterized protein LOC122425624 isoform X2 [Cervus canadensis]
MTTGGHGEVAIRRPRRSLATPDLGLPASRTSGTLVFIHPVYGVRCARRLEGWETLAANSAPLVPTDGADFSGTSNVPDVARTGTWGNLADRNPRAAPASPTPRRAAQDPDQETRRKAGCWTLDGPRRRRGEPAHLAGGENRVSSLPRVPSETTRGTERALEQVRRCRWFQGAERMRALPCSSFCSESERSHPPGHTRCVPMTVTFS